MTEITPEEAVNFISTMHLFAHGEEIARTFCHLRDIAERKTRKKIGPVCPIAFYRAFRRLQQTVIEPGFEYRQYGPSSIEWLIEGLMKTNWVDYPLIFAASDSIVCLLCRGKSSPIFRALHDLQKLQSKASNLSIPQFRCSIAEYLQDRFMNLIPFFYLIPITKYNQAQPRVTLRAEGALGYSRHLTGQELSDIMPELLVQCFWLLFGQFYPDVPDRIRVTFNEKDIEIPKSGFMSQLCFSLNWSILSNRFRLAVIRALLVPHLNLGAFGFNYPMVQDMMDVTINYINGLFGEPLVVQVKETRTFGDRREIRFGEDT